MSEFKNYLFITNILLYQQETEIECKYFKYQNESRMCLLSSSDSPKTTKIKADWGPKSSEYRARKEV